MINVSNDMYRAMQSNTDFKQYITITLTDDTVLNFPDTSVDPPRYDIVVQGNSITSSGGTNGIPLGMAIAKTIRVEIANFDDRYSDYDFYGARIQIQIKYTYPDSGGNTLTTTIPYGYYTVITPETLGTTIVITAVDDMHKADKPFSSNLPFPGVRADALLGAVCSSCGISLQTVTFTNGSFTIKEKPTDCTFREVIGGIAMLAGGNAFINRDGRLEIKPYDTSMSQSLLESDGLYYKPWLQTIQKDGGSFNPWESGDGDVLDGGTYSSNRLGCHILYAWTNDPAVDTDDITITGLALDTGKENRVLYGAEGYILTVTNPCVVGKESTAVALAGPLIVGLKFRAFSGTYIGDPTMEFMDDCVVVDRKGNTYSSFLTDVTYNFRGTTEIKNSAEPVIRNNSSYNGTTKTIQRARRIMDEKLSTYDLGVKNLSELMGNSLGFYTTEEAQEDGSKVYYIHNKPTIAQSDYVYKRTAQGYAQSIDGGQTWTSGVDYMGNAVMRTISAKKISADDITSGRLLVGTNSNPVFYADLTNNKVYINAKDSQNRQTFLLDSETGRFLIDAKDSNGNTVLGIDSGIGGLTIRANTFSLQGQTIQQIASASAAGQISNAFTQEAVFNALTQNGTIDAIEMDENGNLYINLTYLAGGELRVKNRDNETTLYVNGNTGQVDIKANSFSLGGQSIAQIASGEASSAFSNLTQEEVFNKLIGSSGGNNQGIYLDNGTLYLNWEYARGGQLTLGGGSNYYGYLQIQDENNKKYIVCDNEGIKMFDWGYNTDGEVVYTQRMKLYEDGITWTGFGSIGPYISGIAISCGDYWNPLYIRGDHIRFEDSPSSFFTEPTLYMRCVQDRSTSQTYIETGSGVSTYGFSDRRAKENIEDSGLDYLNVVARFRVVSFDWRDKHSPHVSAGLIAQEVEEVIPELVVKNPEGMYAINFSGIIPILVGACQKQQEIIEEQQKRIDGLEERLARLERMVGNV